MTDGSHLQWEAGTNAHDTEQYLEELLMDMIGVRTA